MKMIEVLERHGVSFVSLTQQWIRARPCARPLRPLRGPNRLSRRFVNTTTSKGRLMLNILLRMAEGPETSRILNRRLVSLTTHRSIGTIPLTEKGRLKFLVAVANRRRS